MVDLGFNLGINKRLVTKFSDTLFLDKRFIAGTLVPDALESIGLDKKYSHFYDNYILKYPTYEELKNITFDDLAFGYCGHKTQDNSIKLEKFFEYNTLSVVMILIN